MKFVQAKGWMKVPTGNKKKNTLSGSYGRDGNWVHLV